MCCSISSRVLQVVQGRTPARRRAIVAAMPGKVDYIIFTLSPGAAVNAPHAMREFLFAAGLGGATSHAPVFVYRFRSGALIARLSRGMLLCELRNHVMALALVPG